MRRRDSSIPLFSSDGSRQRLGKLVIVPISAHLGLLILFDLRGSLAAFLALSAAGFAGVLWAERQLRGVDPKVLMGPILLVAAVLRGLLLPLPPTLSEDVERYVWDGRVLSAGFNPYELAPDAPELESLRDELWKNLPHRQIATVYPPLAQALFLLAASLPASVYVLKALLVSLDLGTCALLLRLCRQQSLPPERTIWYAWNPLVTVEIAAMGHVDGLGVALVVLTTTTLVAAVRRPAMASIGAAGAVLAKVVPILCFPVWSRISGRALFFLGAALALVAIGLLPVFLSTGGLPPGWIEYGVSWEFNGPVFEPLWRILDRIALPSTVHAGLDRLKEMSGEHEFWNRLYRFNYPQLWAKALLAMGLLVALIWSWRTENPMRALRRVFGSVLIFSATVYPWYALWVLPWAALTRHPAWLALSGLLLISYVPQVWDLAHFPWVHALIWLPFMLLLLARTRWFTR